MKKLLAFLMAMILLLSLAAFAFAEGTEYPTITVSTNAESGYSFNIPATVNLTADNGYTANSTLSVSDWFMEPGAAIKVTLNQVGLTNSEGNKFVMKNGSSEIPFSISDGTTNYRAGVDEIAWVFTNDQNYNLCFTTTADNVKQATIPGTHTAQV